MDAGQMDTFLRQMNEFVEASIRSAIAREQVAEQLERIADAVAGTPDEEGLVAGVWELASVIARKGSK